MPSPTLSIIVPVFNEEDCLQATYGCLIETLDRLELTYEILFINDGSTDRSEDIIAEFARKDARVRGFSFSRNFGHEAATTCGFAQCKGQAAILIDADLQDPPELIPEMVKKWQAGYEIVAGRRSRREGEPALKKVTSYLFYRMMNYFSEVQMPHDVGDFRLADRKVIDQLNMLPERNRFVRGLFPWIGFRHCYIDYERKPRIGGRSKYNYLKLAILSLDALSSFSLAPLRIAFLIGLVVTLFSMASVGTIFFQKLIYGIDIPGYAFLASGIFFFGGIQVLFLGIVGEYVGKIYKEVQGRPLYIVKNMPDKHQH